MQLQGFCSDKGLTNIYYNIIDYVFCHSTYVAVWWSIALSCYEEGIYAEITIVLETHIRVVVLIRTRIFEIFIHFF